MKLRSLQLHGFKSFANKTDIQFHEGITAIVGPNGCGKSNISDAIRWVLGEQRPTAIRGAKMEEAIFQGSLNRRPVNRGSVILTVSNEEGILPIPFEEVEIGRTVYRDGGSEYSLNRSSCRLKDVHDVCRDTGLGANAYAVIESKMIDAILSDRAEERRGLFEEAAGIGKYKDRRKAALRRLERAELDLQRLDDVIGEVETKVRSLARQKGKAERYHELRSRRLALDVTVVRQRISELQARLDDVGRELEGDTLSEEGVSAELKATETRYETLRIERVEAEKERIAAASRLEEIRSELVRWERDLAVAEERALYARRRLQTIGSEREERRESIRTLTRDEEGLLEARAAVELELKKAQEEAGRSEAVVASIRSRLQESREALEGVEAEEREVLRRGAQLEGDAGSAEAQAADLSRREDELRREMEEAAHLLSDLQSQGDLFSDRIATLQAAVEGVQTEVEGGTRALESARAAFEGARAQEMAAANTESGLAARLAALERMDQDQEGVEPVVRAALALGEPGVLGTLADFISAAPEVVGAVERFLGPLTRGLIVQDRAAAIRLQHWFLHDWKKGGGLIVLPLEHVPTLPKGAKKGSLLEEIRAEGAGAPWVEALLHEIEIVSEDDLHGEPGRERLSRSGPSIDRLGVVRIGNPSGASGILERREALKGLRKDAGEARVRAEEARDARAVAHLAQAAAETFMEEARARLRVAEDSARAARAEEAAQVDRRGRMDRQRDELDRQIESVRISRDRAVERAKEALRERASLLVQEEALRERRASARTLTDEVQEEWEAARAEESAIRVRLARLDGEAARVRERQGNVVASRESATSRISALDLEEKGLGDEMEKVQLLQEEGAERTEALFLVRDEAELALRERDERMARVAEAVTEAERRVRTLRTAERETVDRRHRLELEHQEVSGKIERVRERVEGEWGRPLQSLIQQVEPVDGEIPELQVELRDVVSKLESLGPVNMLAVDEHEEEKARFDFLSGQRDDLMSARDDLRSAVREINQTATALFNENFETIRENFRSTFQRLFEGGECDLWLTDPDDPLESPVEIHASPVGKKTQRIDLLSGGERALTALSLLFGIYLVKPSPFCVLDEIDAPLDESNIGRFIRLLQEFKGQSQFVVITHNPRTIEAADWIYGVTMEEPGVSTIVGVRLEEALEVNEQPAT